MIDVGLGDFLARLEKAAGKRATNWLVRLVGVAIALLCAKIIWEIAISPAIDFYTGTLTKTGFWRSMMYVVWIGIAWIVGAATSTMIVMSLLRWHQVRLYNLRNKRMRRVLNETRALSTDLQDAIKSVQETYSPATRPGASESCQQSGQ